MKRASVLIVIAFVAAIAARIAEPAHQRQAHFSAALACGVERWQIKTLQDRPRLLRAPVDRREPRQPPATLADPIRESAADGAADLQRGRRRDARAAGG